MSFDWRAKLAEPMERIDPMRWWREHTLGKPSPLVITADADVLDTSARVPAAGPPATTCPDPETP